MHKKLVIFAMGVFLCATSFFVHGVGTSQVGQADVIVALARAQLERGEVKGAEGSYRKALSVDPLNAAALRGLIALYRQQGMVMKAQVMFAQLTPAQRSELGPSLRQIEAALLQDQADMRLAKGQRDQAIKYLEQAVQADADDTWLHFKLAKQYGQRGSVALGEALLEDFQTRHPNDPDALYALALYQGDTGDTSNALKTLNRIEEGKRSRDMILLQKRLMTGNLARDSKSLMESGKKDEVVNMLSEAESIAAGNEELMLTVALAWAEIGEVSRGWALLDGAKAKTPPSVSWHLSRARFLAAIKSEQELRQELDYLAAVPELSPSEKTVLAELQEAAAIREADNHIAAGKTAAARRTLEPFLKQKPDEVRLLLADARIYRAERRWKPALDIYARILEWDKQNLEARAGLIDALVASGQRATAMRQMDEWAGTRKEVYVGVHLSGLYEKLGEYDRARQVIDSLLAGHPEATYVLYDGWKLAQRAGRVDDEIFYLKKLVIAEPYVRPGSSASVQAASRQVLAYEDIGIGEFGSSDRIQRDWKEKKLAGLIDRRSRWFSAAADVRYRGGTYGLSEFRSVEVPLEYRTPWHASDEAFFRTDLVRLSAGTVDPTSDIFGSMLLCQPDCAAAPLRQTAQGVSFTAGYQRGELSADLGVTPLNFPVSNTVGGIRQGGDIGPLGYSLEASRRPVTASLLSYAGTEDPNTGRVWGGVVATGARLGLSLDKGEAFGFWSSFSWHNLTGRNVQSNRRIQVMAGEQWRLINEENRRLVIGIVGMYWNFSDNVGEYTFGHGGYYSPYKYRSWSLPVSFTARSPRFSYLLRASVSTSRTQMLDAPLYPTDAALQLAAGNPFYTGGPGSKGTGHSAMAAWEYQAAPQLFVGGLFAIDRSDYYAPNRALLYLRYAFDRPAAQPVFMPPEPVEPTSQF